jgi:hypothetical protein
MSQGVWVVGTAFVFFSKCYGINYVSNKNVET